MRFFSKLKVMTAVISAAAMLAGCGSSAPSSPTAAPADSPAATASASVSAATDASTSGADSSQPITLSVWGYSPNLVDVDKQIADGFTALHPNVTVKITENAFDQYPSLLATQFQSGQAPDAFVTSGFSTSTMMDMADQNLLEPMETLFDPSQYPDWLLKFFTYNGHIWTKPGMLGDMVGGFYNKKVFAANNLSLPQSQADMDNILATLAKTNITPITIPGKTGADLYYYFGAMVQAYAADWNSNFPWGGSKFTDPAFKAVVQQFADWRDKGYFGSDYQANDVNSCIMELLQGKAAMFVDGEWNAQSMNGSPDIGVFFFKRPDGLDAGWVSPSQSSGLSVYANSPNKDMTLQFVDYFTSKDVQQLLLNMYGLPLDFPLAQGLTVADPLVQAMSTPSHSDLGLVDTIGAIPKKGVEYFTGMSAELQSYLFKQVDADHVITTFESLVDYNNLIK